MSISVALVFRISRCAVRWLKFVAISLLWPLYFVSAILTHVGVSLFCPSLRWKVLSKLIRSFNLLVRAVLNIKIILEGDRGRLDRGGHLVVCNHLSYVDGIILGSIIPLIYVTKKEVRHWPFIGQWTALIGTVFIDRKRKEKTPLVVDEISKRLRQKANVLVFPEGTSTNGEKLLPFQSAHFAAPLTARAQVVPVTLTYRMIDGRPLSPANRDLVYWYGDMEFAGHFWNLLALRSVEVSVKVHSIINTARYKNNSLGRKQLSLACHDLISAKAVEKDFPVGSLSKVGG